MQGKFWFGIMKKPVNADDGNYQCIAFVLILVCYSCNCRDADDAVKARDGYDYDGYRLRVEFPRGGGPGSYRGSRNEGETLNIAYTYFCLQTGIAKWILVPAPYSILYSFIEL